MEQTVQIEFKYSKLCDIKDIKRKATRICNQNFDPIDELFVNFIESGEFIINRCAPKTYMYKYTRRNIVCPNNTIKRGQWK